jgi:hypothetical protein
MSREINIDLGCNKEAAISEFDYSSNGDALRMFNVS